MLGGSFEDFESLGIVVLGDGRCSSFSKVPGPLRIRRDLAKPNAFVHSSASAVIRAVKASFANQGSRKISPATAEAAQRFGENVLSAVMAVMPRVANGQRHRAQFKLGRGRNHIESGLALNAHRLQHK